ncbi:MAG TPA: YbaY family lipoprotein [Paenirhodobacter sp.]
MTQFIPKALLTSCVWIAALIPTALLAETLTGSVTYRERMALPPGAEIAVSLVDVSRADAPAETLAETRIIPETQVPVPFSLSYDASRITPGHSYALQARISHDGQLMFISTTRHPVLTGGTDETQIVVERVAAGPSGSWLAEDIGGGGVVDRVQTVLALGADGAVSGSGGCNRLTGKATIDGDKISFGPIASTMMACPPAVMDQERKFFTALSATRGWRIDAAQHKLMLIDAAGATVVVLAQQ